MFGDEGYDYLEGGAGDDVLHGGADNDRLVGDDDVQATVGSGSSDVLLGEDGDDWLMGGAGVDNLYGGAGQDWFVFAQTTDSREGAADRILDFDPTSDILDLIRIDADLTTAGDQAFTLNGASLIGRATLDYDAGDNLTFLKLYNSAALDGNGLPIPASVILIDGHITDATGFLM
jgi:Ca2+-binding RTX toxin-like protein